MLKLMQQTSMMSLDRFQGDVLATKAKFDRSDAILAGDGRGVVTRVYQQLLPLALAKLLPLANYSLALCCWHCTWPSDTRAS